MIVGILALLQESNSFSPGTTTLADFADDVLLTGAAIRTRFADAHHEIGGFLAGLDAAGVEVVPIFAARAVPGAPIEATAFKALFEQLMVALRQAGKLDGVLAAAHGATVSDAVRDVDGHWLAAVRHHLGGDVPLIATLDPHANLSPQMVASCDALIAYRTNPHLDQRERGLEAAELMARTLRGEVQPKVAAAFPPLAIGIESQCTAESPGRDWLESTAETAGRPGVLSASAIFGFPYADVEEMGSACVVVADGDAQLAQLEANRLAEWLWNRREEFDRQPISIAAAIRELHELAGPVCLLDVGDNIGGGGPADSTHLAQACIAAGVGPTLVCLTDSRAVELAYEAGVGHTFSGRVGGQASAHSGTPLAGEFRVRALVAGRFSETKARHGGWVEFDQGPTAVLDLGDQLTMIVNSQRTPPFSLAQVTSCGLDPADFRVLIAKGVHAPVAAYREVCPHLIRVDTPGVTSADMTRFSYRFRRRPLFPFERDFAWTKETP